MLESLPDKVADFNYSLQSLLRRKLDTGVFLQGSFLRLPLATAPVKRLPFSVMQNAGKNCHSKVQKLNQYTIPLTSTDYVHKD